MPFQQQWNKIFSKVRIVSVLIQQIVCTVYTVQGHFSSVITQVAHSAKLNGCSKTEHLGPVQTLCFCCAELSGN